jgi:hypothetical protein
VTVSATARVKKPFSSQGKRYFLAKMALVKHGGNVENDGHDTEKRNQINFYNDG